MSASSTNDDRDKQASNSKTEQFDLSPLGRKILLNRYVRREPYTGRCLEHTPHEVFRRVAQTLALVNLEQTVLGLIRWKGKGEVASADLASRSLERLEALAGEARERLSYSGEQSFKEFATDLCKRYGKRNEDAGMLYGMYKLYYELMINKDFTPAGRTLATVGVPGKDVVCNCIVLHPHDTLLDDERSIMQTMTDAVRLQRKGCGLGFPFHLLRPSGEPTRHARSSGSVSYLRMYDTAFGTVKGNSRNGANMGVMSIEHPDVLDFMRCKSREGDIANFNVSVSLTDEFLEQATDEKHPRYRSPWYCTWKGKLQLPHYVVSDEEARQGRILTALGHYEECELHGHSAFESDYYRSGWHDEFAAEAHTEIRLPKDTVPGSLVAPGWTARRLLAELCAWAHWNGEPGFIFADEVKRSNPLPGLGSIEACNPCGEQFLHDGDVCNLGSINLARFVRTDEESGKASIDEKRLTRVAETAARMLDNVIDLYQFGVKRVDDMARGNRRIGLGVMGLADALYMLGLRYGSPEAQKAASTFMRCVHEGAELASQSLCTHRGTFPNYDKSVHSVAGRARRNASLTTVAPTGTISQLFGVNGGLEPYFMLSYSYRHVLQDANANGKHYRRALKRSLKECPPPSESSASPVRDDQMVGLHWLLERQLREALGKDKDLLEAVREEIIERGNFGGPLAQEHVPEHIRHVFVTAQDLRPQDFVSMQSAMQRHCDNSISRTVNLPNRATLGDVCEAVRMGWKCKLKSFTVYRDGSRQKQVLNANSPKQAKSKRREALASSSSSSVSSSSASTSSADSTLYRLDVSADTRRKINSSRKGRSLLRSSVSADAGRSIYQHSEESHPKDDNEWGGIEVGATLHGRPIRGYGDPEESVVLWEDADDPLLWDPANRSIYARSPSASPPRSFNANVIVDDRDDFFVEEEIRRLFPGMKIAFNRLVTGDGPDDYTDVVKITPAAETLEMATGKTPYAQPVLMGERVARLFQEIEEAGGVHVNNNTSEVLTEGAKDDDNAPGDTTKPPPLSPEQYEISTEEAREQIGFYGPPKSPEQVPITVTQPESDTAPLSDPFGSPVCQKCNN